MGLLGRIVKRVTERVDSDEFLENGKDLIGDIGSLLHAQTVRIVKDPFGVAKQIIIDVPVALFGRQPDLIQDAKDIAHDTLQIVIDGGINLFNAVSGEAQKIDLAHLPGSIALEPGKAVTTTNFEGGAAIGDLSWLIYNQNRLTNKEICGKWQRYDFTETVGGYDSSTYVDKAGKQVAITFEGTSPNSDLSPWVLSKDGFSDLEIGLGVLPNQVVEGYGRFRALLDKVRDDFGSKGYGITLAGHSLGGGLAEMMAGMYFIDTGVALPTVAQEAPGMLRQLRLYAQERLIAGQSIHLPTGGTIKLQQGTLLQRAEAAKNIAASISGQDFGNVINLLTEQDPVGQIWYDKDPAKDGHVGVNVLLPAMLTARECLQDIDYEALKPVNGLNLVTPQMPRDILNILPAINDIDLSRIDRHLPGQSEGLWSGSALGLYDEGGSIGLGVQAERTNGEPTKKWAGSLANTPEVLISGDGSGKTIDAAQYVSGKQNALVQSDSGIIYGSGNGDFLLGGSGSTTIYGIGGDNYLSGGSGNARLYGGKGNDILYAGSGQAFMSGGEGDDLLFGGKGSATFQWDKGNDIMYNGQAGGNYEFIVADGASGDAQIKWQRNFSNIGSSVVELQGRLASDSHLVFNFVDDIHFKEMKWSVQGEDILLSDSRGDKPGTVLFKDAFNTFAAAAGQLDFKFANGKLYKGDQTYHVVTGDSLISSSEADFAGSIVLASGKNDELFAGKGEDVLIGGKGEDHFNFSGDFACDYLINADAKDTVCFNAAFSAADFVSRRNGSDLVISYQGGKLNELTIDNWYASENKVTHFTFAKQDYKFQGDNFIKL